MRFIKTFVLHFYVDVDAPERICGNIRPLEDQEHYSFKNLVEFEEVLHRLIRKSSGPQSRLNIVDLGPDKEIQFNQK